MTCDGTVYGQQRDLWFHAMTVAIAATAAALTASGFLCSNVILLIAGAGVAVVLATCLLPSYFRGRYELGEEAVRIRFHLTDLTIPYRDIISAGTVSWTRTFIMAPTATSLKFVEVRYREGRHNRYVSFTPADRERFVEELNARRTGGNAPFPVQRTRREASSRSP